MIDRRQRAAIARYSSLARNPRADAATGVGRASDTLHKTRFIWADIARKLQLRRGARMLDLGCGFGDLTRHCLEARRALAIELVLFDIPGVLRRLRREFGPLLREGVRLHPGVFPATTTAQFRRAAPFDLILAYSVLHYTDNPLAFVNAATRLLAPGGRLLIGDLPNVNRKGRFLASDAGRAFEARYRGVPVDALPRYRSHRDFVRRGNIQNGKISDRLVVQILGKCRAAGLDAYVLPQDHRLPYCHTREDILICRP